MNISTTTQTFGYSSKRHATWQGMQVAFNKAHTIFFEIAEEINNWSTKRDSNGGWILQGRLLELSEEEKNELLNAWRHGKQEWYRQNAALPLRAAAEKAKAIAISNPA